ncbi:hypothetical protein ONS95_013011 [Cadophora gregata]|uniref:uncharacterized protein n=1 Tax=Cadophora gregata TaxID=51156 RepID=UPI0026DC460D|nr:uncharacterized protein ONS95_013011 [Cadophora gregata]KAK0100999.1 hypothetical protein ONS96_006231 [Cadophora gregata f. sp. sojae]KAK0115970.1 hypothetical protein ONS95_013011 [Cadophora gregata]
MGMTWLSVLEVTFYYVSLPITIIFRWIVACLTLVSNLAMYISSGFLLPLRFLAKFETMFIYLGVAAVIGLITGSILHLSSSLLDSVFNLTTAPEETGRSAASVRAAREQKKLEQAWDRIPTKSTKGDLRSDPEMERFAEWLEKGDHGVLGQTILEEDDSDDLDGF